MFLCILDDCRCRGPVDTITIDVEVDVQDVSMTYSNGLIECVPRHLGNLAAGNTIYIPLLPACGNMTISASTLSCIGCAPTPTPTPILSACQQYNGPQRNVVIETIPGGCSIQAIII